MTSGEWLKPTPFKNGVSLTRSRDELRRRRDTADGLLRTTGLRSPDQSMLLLLLLLSERTRRHEINARMHDTNALRHDQNARMHSDGARRHTRGWRRHARNVHWLAAGRVEQLVGFRAADGGLLRASAAAATAWA